MPPTDFHADGPPTLLILDMISRWDFAGGAELLEQAVAIAPAIARLRDRCRSAGVPVIYANDPLDRWRAEFRDLVSASRAAGPQAAQILRLLAPATDDYFVVKPKHSAFLATPLDLLLRHLRSSRLILAGVSADQGVLATAIDARMHDRPIVVPANAVAAVTPERTQAMLLHCRRVLEIETPMAEDVALTNP
jgi:nicotinamidase-related amidase